MSGFKFLPLYMLNGGDLTWPKKKAALIGAF